MKRMISSAVALALGLIGVAGLQSESREQFVDRLHAFFVKRFDDVELAKRGIVGPARVVASSLRNHGASNGDPGYGSREWANFIEIYGNKGAKLDPATIRSRWRRMANANVPLPDVHETLPNFVKSAAAAFAKGRKEPMAISHGASRFEARAIRLTKRDCLKCHKDAKLGDPVAVVLYATAPMR